LYDKILNSPLNLSHKSLSVNAKDLLSKILEKKQGDRIKPENIKKHPFFAAMNFEGLLRKEVPAPFRPKVASSTDVKYFDSYYTGMDPIKDESTHPSGTINKSGKGILRIKMNKK